ncbi:class I SAM-dependent methyltransferase [Bifidobacterium choloepi]|nr:class I SAM-dependent methyltransferase [Bifidobacterium choloepi]
MTQDHGIGGFNGKAALYDSSRPGYAPALFETLKAQCGLDATSPIVEVGAGTGKFTVGLLGISGRVTAVEPNPDMRAIGERLRDHYPTLTVVDGTDVHTGLPDHCADLICAAQAFHWFDVDGFRKESLRVLKESDRSYAALVWNTHNRNDEVWHRVRAAMAEVNEDFPGEMADLIADAGEIGTYFGGPFEHFEFPNAQRYDEESFVTRCQSSSWAPSPQDGTFETYTAAIRDIFHSFARDGHVTLQMNSELYLGHVAA